MGNELTRVIEKVQEELQRQAEIKREFDQRVEKILSEHDLIKKIKVPHYYINLWKKQGKQVEVPINWRYLISSPFIYGMIVPAVIWHVGLEIYHQVCFRLYGIPLVDHRDYFIYDRQLLSWLNPWERANCMYCSYVNNLVRYSSEIGGRTERYWCPIKYYRRISHAHSQYGKFADIKDAKQFRKQWEELREFTDLKKA